MTSATTSAMRSLFLSACVPLFALADSAGAQEAIRVDTLPGGRVVVSNPDLPGLAGVEAPTLVENLRIGSLDEICDSFGQAFSLAVDGSGRIHVADTQVNEIRVFSAQGECLETIGRSGEGPGEFSMLAGIAWQPSGFLWAMDAMHHRLTVFDPAGETLATQRFGSGRAASLPWLAWVDSARSLHLWHPGERAIVRYAPGPEIVPLDTLAVPRIESDAPQRVRGVRGGDAQSRVITSAPTPHSPRIAWTVGNNGNLWLAHTSSFELHETTWSGDTIRTVRLERPPPRLEGRERDSLATARGIPARSLPEHKRILQRFSVGADGWIWVERGETPIRVWDVFDERGRYLGPVAPPVPIEDEPFPVFGDGTITAVTKDDLEVQYVVRLRVVR